MKKKSIFFTCLEAIIISGLFLGAFLNFGTAQSGSSGDWPMFRSDPSHSGIGTGNPPLAPTLLWKYTTNGSSGTSSPAVADGVVYISSLDSLYALNATTGIQLWNYVAGFALPSPAVVNGVVYIGYIALNATSGIELWKYPVSFGGASSAAVVNGVVYMGGEGGYVYALNATTGAKLWNYTPSDGYISSPAVLNDVVYIGTQNGNVYALNATNGIQLWKYTTDFRGSLFLSSPAVADGVVYIGEYDSCVYALNATNGIQLWKYATESAREILSSPAVVNGTVYIGAYDGSLYALNATSGAKLWKCTGSSGVSSPAVVNGVVYLGFDAINSSSGAKLWNYPGGLTTSSPAVVNGILYIGAYDGSVYALGGPTACISPSSWIMNAGQSKTFSASPSGGSGAYTRYQWYVNGMAQSGQNAQTFDFAPFIAGSYSVTVTVTDSSGATSGQNSLATVTVNPLIITVTQNVNGMISPTTTNVNYENNQTFTITPNNGYYITDVIVDSVSKGAISSYTFTNVNSPHTIAASFAISTFFISVTQTNNGVISPGITIVDYGSSRTYSIIPNTGHYVASLTIDGTMLSAAPSYTFNNVQSNHTISATFSLTPTPTPLPTTTPTSVTNPTPTSTITLTPTPTTALTQTQISISSDASSTAVGASVNVNGKLSDTSGNPLPNKTITLSYTLAGSSNNIPIGSDSTTASGEYNLQWVNTASGTFTLKVDWSGDTIYQPTSNATTLNFLPYQNQNIFLVESNSTVTALAFNSTSNELSFSIAGLSETTGYVKATIAKSLISNPENIKVYLDGTQLNYIVTSNADSWQLTFNYHHSTHQVKIALVTNQVSNTYSGSNSILIIAIAATAAIIGVAALGIWLMKKRSVLSNR